MATRTDTMWYRLQVEIDRAKAFCDALHKDLAVVPLDKSALDMTVNELTATAVILEALLADLENEIAALRAAALPPLAPTP